MMRIVTVLLGLALIGVASASGLAAYDGWKGGWKGGWNPYALNYAGSLGWKGGVGWKNSLSWNTGLGYGGWNNPIGFGWKGLRDYKYAPHYGSYGLDGIGGLYGLGYGYGNGFDLEHPDYLDPWY